MKPSKLLPLFLLVIVTATVDGQIVIVTSTATVTATVDARYSLCDEQDGNFTSNETYGTTLDTLLGSITTTTSGTLTYGLFNVSASRPEDPDDIQVLGVCSGDVTGDDCRDCLNAAAQQVRQNCPTKKRATLFEDKCWIRYSGGQLYGVLRMDTYMTAWNVQNASDGDQFKTVLLMLLGRLQSEAASGGPIRKYATGNYSVDLSTAYGMVQCSPDLSYQQCIDCVGEATWRSARDKVGGSLLTHSCRSRFERYQFFNAVAVPLPPPPPPPSALPPATTTTTIVPPPPPPPLTWIIVSASIGSAVIVVICILVFLKVKRKKRPKKRSMTEVIDENVVTAESLQFDLNIIRDATENFSEANKLGQGGFGSVYKGKLPSGQEIAVKRLSQNSGQGESEFKNEARLLSRLQHRNLVRLLGYCLEGIERLLVYEFVPNSSLDKLIFDPLKRAILGWDTRYKIITGITRGLLYLHEDSRLRIIHRDLKAANILLDMDMNPKLSDFGMARLFELDQTQADTNRIMGTYGYMAPEYVGRGIFSVKSDAFSFGVMVLEIVSGRRNLVRHSGEDSEMLISHAWTNWREGNVSNIVDPEVSSGYSSNILRCIHIGLLCVQENATDRPKMSSVVRWLDNESVALPVPTQPAFFPTTSTGKDISFVFDGTSRSTETGHSRNIAGTFSINEASITKPYPR